MYVFPIMWLWWLWYHFKIVVGLLIFFIFPHKTQTQTRTKMRDSKVVPKTPKHGWLKANHERQQDLHDNSGCAAGNEERPGDPWWHVIQTDPTQAGVLTGNCRSAVWDWQTELAKGLWSWVPMFRYVQKNGWDPANSQHSPTEALSSPGYSHSWADTTGHRVQVDRWGTNRVKPLRWYGGGNISKSPD